ncbi:MAG: hypothetical protein J1F12_08840 [Muribaculaceae bacterium]|nr:hypothetical protein [Muribaculaceae bacterium]
MNFLYHIKDKLAGFVNISGVQCTVLSILCIVLFALSSCTDDLHLNSDNDTPGEDFTGITLLVPNLDYAAEYGATRSDGYANTRAYDQAREGNFNTLYITAIDQKDGSAHIFQRNQSDGLVESVYNRYQISLPEGTYKFYVVANLNRYLFEQDNSTTFYDKIHGKEKPEDEIRKLILNFSASRPLEPGFLPMACLAEDIKVGSTASTAQTPENNLVSVATGENTYIYADMNFLCSKVRYTIFFDREKATQFGTNDIIDFHRHTSSSATPFVSFLRQQTALNYKDDAPVVNPGFIPDINSSESEYANWMLFLDRYKYTGDYVLSGEQAETGKVDFYDETNMKKVQAALEQLSKNPWSESDGEWSSETFRKKRAWQGVAYLPENLVGEGGQPTVLNFPYSFNSVEGADSPRKIELKDFKIKDSETLEPGIRKGRIYDVYAVVTKPDAEQLRVNVIVDDWKLETLLYQLHGPYELIVETTKIKELGMEEDVVFWFKTDLDPSLIEFESPKISKSGNTNNNDLVNIFTGKVVRDSKGIPVKNDDGAYLFQVGINLEEIPYLILDELNQANGIDWNGVHYSIKDISYFHLVAGSIHKRIEIDNLDLDPYLNVSPQTIIIDTRELYTSGMNSPSYAIKYETNVDPTEQKVKLSFTDIDALLQGKGLQDGKYALQITKSKDYPVSGNVYTINNNLRTDSLYLNIKDVIEGNSFWDKNNEFTLTFRLEVERQNAENFVVERPVTIKVKPFSGTYTIHFRDNTKYWGQPHIYVYQDLTLPSDMEITKDGENYERYEHAGKIVGYIEENPSSGLQWNAAVQYVFSNNLAFRGWYGSNQAKWDESKNRAFPVDNFNMYGGPELNDPWEEAYYKAEDHTGNESSLDVNTTTMGFVMFGKPEKRGSDTSVMDYKELWFWNYDYSYTKTYGLVPSSKRFERYNYDINFNGEHQETRSTWSCTDCYEMWPDFNKNDNERFYTGIAMEPEGDGWWKYTLTGVAQPGRTMIIFANWHMPWDPENEWFDYRAEDYRWPGDYEAGLPLFDFEDNNGYFLFDGNTSNTDQKFTNIKPTNVLPQFFTGEYGGDLKIEIYNPKHVKITGVSFGYQHKIKIGKEEQNRWSVEDEYHELTATASAISQDGDIYSFTVNPGMPENYEHLAVNLTLENGTTKRFLLPTKFFKKSGGVVVTAQPLMLQFKENTSIFVKWNDQVQRNTNYWGSNDFEDRNNKVRYPNRFKDVLLRYDPPKNGGSKYLNVYWGNTTMNTSTLQQSYPAGHEIGNYKNADVMLKNVPDSEDKIRLRLCTSNGVGDETFYKMVKAEDLPQYYYPAQNKYLINWHLLPIQ